MTAPLDRPDISSSTRRAFLRRSALFSLSGLVVACGGSDTSTSAPDGATRQVSGTDRALDGEPVDVWRDPG